MTTSEPFLSQQDLPGVKHAGFFHLADEFGPAKIVHITEPGIGLRAVAVIDNVAIGPAIGGVRMAPDATAEEAFRLARAMTFKNAAAGLSHGGGKSVIIADPGLPLEAKEQLIRAFAVAIRELSDYIPGPDMGTDERAMGWVHAEIGRAVGLPRALGGIPLDEIGATGWGLTHAIEVALGYLDLSLQGARVAVQGFGAVGAHAARFLAGRGALLVAAADITGTIADPGGLDVPALLALKHAGKPLQAYPGAQRFDPGAVIDVPCDIWIPAARPDVVNVSNVARLNTRLVAQGANIPCTAGAELALHERGVLVLPDFIANAGGVICGSVEYHGGTEVQAFETIAEKIRANTQRMLETAFERGEPPRQAALEMAAERLHEAMTFGRFATMNGRMMGE